MVLKFIREGTVEIYAIAKLIMFSYPSISYDKKNGVVSQTRHSALYCASSKVRFVIGRYFWSSQI
jgi:hypothetical protein